MYDNRAEQYSRLYSILSDQIPEAPRHTPQVSP